MNDSRLINQMTNTSQTSPRFNVVTDIKIKCEVNEREGLEKSPEAPDFYTKIPKKINLWCMHRRKKHTSCPARNYPGNLTENTEKTESNEKYLFVRSKTERFLRNNMHATLFVTNEDPRHDKFATKFRSHNALSLCKHALLCFIEPSNNVTVQFEENLKSVTETFLGEGCSFHFPSMRNMVSDELTEFTKKPQQPIFKNSSFQQQFRPISTSGKKRTWRSLKQVLAQERSLPWPPEVVHYSCINAPPSFKPAKKYSDISGLPARYTDPQTKLYYATAEEFSTVRSLPMDITAGYLALRGASSIVG